MHNNLISLAGHYVSKLLINSLSVNLTFHNLFHTLQVVNGARIICRHEKLSESEIEIVLLSAWFHDCGHVVCYENHEVESQKIASYFLQKQHYNKAQIRLVLNNINGTKMPQNPVTLTQKIICDADLFHLTLPEYPYLQYLLREEWRRELDLDFSDEEWNIENLDFLKQHQYFTQFGRQVLQKKKAENIAKFLTKTKTKTEN